MPEQTEIEKLEIERIKTTQQATLKQLEKAFNDNDGAEFKKHYLEYLKDNFREFNVSYRPKSDGKKTITALNPMFGGENFHLATTQNEDGNKILLKSKDAQKIYEKMGTDAHLDFLNILQEKIDKYSPAIKLTVTADMGKPIDLTNAEVDSKGKAWFDYAKNNLKDQLKTTSPKLKRAALGVSQVIGAFNYPFALSIPGIVGSLATGNSLVITTPEKAPNWVFPMMEAAHEAVNEFTKKHTELTGEEAKSLKNGLIQYSIGRDPTISTKADMVHFVGGDAAGKKIKEARGTKPTLLELGGGNVVVVMDDAITKGKTEAEIKKLTKEQKDEIAKEQKAATASIAKNIYDGFGPATGQRCTAPRILIVQDGAALAVAEELEAKCADGPVIGRGGIGNPFTAKRIETGPDGKPVLGKDGKPKEESGTQIGPLVDASAYERMKAIIELANTDEYKALGVKVHGKLDANTGNAHLPEGGRWVNPVVIDWSGALKDKDKAKKIYDLIKKDEVFAPLVHIIHPVKNIEEAIHLTNDLDTHNLASAIFTSNDKTKETFFAKTFAVSKAHNKAPKDESPVGHHGHPDEKQIGGDDHFKHYTQLIKVVMDKAKSLTTISR